MPKLVEDVLGHLDPAQGRVADLVDIDDLPGHRLVLRRREGDVLGARIHPLTHGLEQLAAAGDLVQECEDRASGLGFAAHVPPPPPPPPLALPATAGSGPPTWAPSPPMMAWRAPGTPNS